MQVLEWNGVPLTSKTYEEVQCIIGQPCAEVELCVRLWVPSVIIYPCLAAVWHFCTRAHILPTLPFCLFIPHPFIWHITLWLIAVKLHWFQLHWFMCHHKSPVWIQTATLICCLTPSTHKPWSTFSSLRLVCTRITWYVCMHACICVPVSHTVNAEFLKINICFRRWAVFPWCGP